jgi:hypothetical protein
MVEIHNPFAGSAEISVNPNDQRHSAMPERPDLTVADPNIFTDPILTDEQGRARMAYAVNRLVERCLAREGNTQAIIDRRIRQGSEAHAA